MSNLKFIIIISGVYIADVEPTIISYESVTYLRSSMVRRWYDTYHLINVSCDNIQDRKFFTGDRGCWEGFGLNINWMPLPNLVVLYPPFRLVFYTYMNSFGDILIT